MGKIFIGTSGWTYDHWNGIFYPKKFSSLKKLRYFSKQFNTVEINYSFYHSPRPLSYLNWYSSVPSDFVFSVKANRLFTHIKKLKNIKTPLKQFIENALFLKEKLGVILFQFPSSFKYTNENFKKLNETILFLDKLNNEIFLKEKKLKRKLRFAFEFREKGWFNKFVEDLFKKYKIAFVIADSSLYPKTEIISSDFLYLRFHGPSKLFASKYSEKELKNWAKKIRNWLKNKDVYVYFNNDFFGYAVFNAKTLKGLLKEKN
jgi:uncharacterized protein YecE (DUF72 family)